ncbi:hypothetical protein B0J17DRAFT_380208 [Rhizoctonia solani]|nr:hypothetical protein B0J17DRAFT_380200 [Rhizoctonia solani]KAH7339965.1 hypothetical protein B0J17DRAFT_380208 [Rhizoctonia solani]
MAQSAPKIARPVALGDILSFDTHPGQAQDLVECVVNWKQEGRDRSEKYMAFKAKNVTAGDTNPLVPVFVQKSYYDKEFGSATGTTEFTITGKWQYGQRDKTGANRFVVLHDPEHKPYQLRFVEGWIVKLGPTVAKVALAFTPFAVYADQVDKLKLILGDPLHSFNTVIVQSGDVLLVPAELKSYSFGNAGPRTVEWQQTGFKKNADYYCFTVVDTTQEGQDVTFFIQKEWYDSDKSADASHISKVATKNANGEYEFKIDAKSQYGQIDGTGKGRWVVYHDKGRKPYQHRFAKSVLQSAANASAVQLQDVAARFGFGSVDLKGLLGFVENYAGDYLHTFA